jgi:hypothetical protein
LDQIEDLDSEASLGDMKYSWLEVGNEIHWRPYYISEKGDETIVYFRSPVVTTAGEIESLPSVFGCYLPFSINISQVMERGWIDSITDIRLMLNEQSGRVELGIESTGSARLWFNEEICNMLTSVDSDLEEFGLPEKPVTDTPSILIVDAATGEAFLFDYDASGKNPAGIGKPTLGPTHHLAQDQWQSVEETEFAGGTQPWTAFIGVNEDGEASLYLSNWATNLQTLLPIYRTTPTDDAFAVAPASHTVQSASWGNFYSVAGRPSWSPDGRRIAFVGLDGDTPSISVYELETGATSHLAKVPALTNFSQGPIWSPDGRWLLYGYGGSSSASLYAASYPEGAVNYIGQGCRPFWINSEDELAIGYHPTCYANQLAVTAPNGTVSNLAEGLDLSGYVKGYASDSKAFLVQRRNSEDRTEDFFLVPLDGSEVRLVYSARRDSETYFDDVLISPHEDWLALRTPGTMSFCHTIIDLNKQRPVFIDSGPGCFEVDAWTNDGKGVIEIWFNISVGDPAQGELAYIFPGLEESIVKAGTVGRVSDAAGIYFDNPILSTP